MNPHGNYTTDRLAAINNQLQDIDGNLDEYFKNYNVRQLTEVLQHNTESQIKARGMKYREFGHGGELKKQEYLQLIQICNQLWIINGLMNELNTESQFEERVRLYLKLEAKTKEIKETSDNSGDSGSIKIFSELDDKLVELKTELIMIAEKKLDQYLLISDNLEIIFTNILNDVDFGTFVKSCRNLFSGDITNSHFNFNKCFNDWLERLLDICDEGYSVSLENTSDALKLTVNKCEPDLQNFVTSIEQLILFFNSFFEKINSLKEFKSIRVIMGKAILKSIKVKIFSKENVYPLIIDKLNYDNGLKGNTSTIAELYKISKYLSSEGWSKDGICELEFWIDDLTNSWVENLLDYTIDELKLFVIDLTNKEKVTTESLLDKNLILQEIKSFGLKEQGTTETKNDDNGWSEAWNEEDDNDAWGKNDNKETSNSHNEKLSKLDDELIDDGGWGDDDDLDLDADSVESVHKDEDDDGWGAWDDEVKIDDNVDEEISINNISNRDMKTSGIPSYKYSKLVNKVMNIIESYMKNYQDLKELEVNEAETKEAEDLFKHGFKKLCISYFMMLESDATEIYRNDILFYNDYNKILEQCYSRYNVDLTTCFKLSSRFINQFMMGCYSKISNFLDEYNGTIWNTISVDDEKKLKSAEAEFFLKFNTEFDLVAHKLNKLSSFNTQLIVNTFVTVIFQTFNTICDRILGKTDISSYESDILIEIISWVIMHIKKKADDMDINIEKIQSYNKLEQIKLVLSNNLKGILDAFYDAKLYEIETHELISLIESSFVESPQRLNAIAEIKSVRETQF